MKKIGLALVVAAVIVAIIIFPSDKKRIQKTITASEQAFIKEDLKSVMDHVSFNYTDDYGGSYLTLKQRIERLFSTYDDFEVYSDIVAITVSGDEALADLRVSIIASVGNERGYLFGDAGSHREIRVYLAKENFGWMIVRLDDYREESAGSRPPLIY